MAKANKAEQEQDNIENKRETCGIIMPISGNDGYTAEHWNDVRTILEEVISEAGFVPNLVSDADEIGIIHNRIVTNIYSNPIVICDVSSKNPNVMFELGLRLAFDKATIIIKDETTPYNFDTGVIEHLTYPRDLRYSIINNFKIKLKDKITATYRASQDPNYSTFLKSFVQYRSKLQTEEVQLEEFVLKQLEDINKQLAYLRSNQYQTSYFSDTQSSKSITGIELLFDIDAENSEFLLEELKRVAVESYIDVFGYIVTKIENRRFEVRMRISSMSDGSTFIKALKSNNLTPIGVRFKPKY
jgi:hypothetical protein